MLNKIFFLINSGCNLEILFKFLYTKLSILSKKTKKNKIKKEHQLFLKHKKITQDYFSKNSYFFLDLLKKLGQFNYLEIGVFEGNSSMFVARKFKNSQIYCVDNWVGTEEYSKTDFKIIENNFDFNIRDFPNITKIKNSSDNFFKENKKKFEVIYVDGYHYASQVYSDFKNAWKCLLPGGYIIFDDYIWQFSKNYEDNPCYAINKYIKELKENYKIIFVTNSQLCIKRLK